MTIDLRKLRQITEVARAQSITTAAHTLAISQPALTRSIAEVENYLGLQLFQRLPRGMRLTEAGKNFVARSKHILADMDDLVLSMNDTSAAETGRIRLGIAPAAYLTFVSDSLTELARDHPGIRLEIISGSVEDLAPKLSSGELSLVMGTAVPMQRWPDLETKILMDLYSTCIVRPDHPLTKKHRVTAIDVLSYPCIMPSSVETVHSDMAQLYVKNKLPPMQSQYVSDDFEFVKQLVLNSDAFSMAVNSREQFSQLEQQFASLGNVIALPTQKLGYAIAKSQEVSPALQLLLNKLSEQKNSTILHEG